MKKHILFTIAAAVLLSLPADAQTVVRETTTPEEGHKKHYDHDKDNN